MLMLISPTQGPKVLTNKHKVLASLRGMGGCYEYFCAPSYSSVNWKSRYTIVLLFYYTHLLTQRRLKTPGVGRGVWLTVKRQQAANLLVIRVFVPTSRECRGMGGCTLLQDPYLIEAEIQRSQASPQICIYSLSCFTQLLHSLIHLRLQHQVALTYWICSPEFCIILGPGCIWYYQLAWLYKAVDINVKMSERHIWALIKMEPNPGIVCWYKMLSAFSYKAVIYCAHLFKFKSQNKYIPQYF